MSLSALVRMTGWPPALTVALPPLVRAEQCLPHPEFPQQGWGVTEIFGTSIGRPLTLTLATPLVATPPAEFASPLR